MSSRAINWRRSQSPNFRRDKAFVCGTFVNRLPPTNPANARWRKARLHRHPINLPDGSAVEPMTDRHSLTSITADADQRQKATADPVIGQIPEPFTRHGRSSGQSPPGREPEARRCTPIAGDGPFRARDVIDPFLGIGLSSQPSWVRRGRPDRDRLVRTPSRLLGIASEWTPFHPTSTRGSALDPPRLLKEARCGRSRPGLRRRSG